MTRAVVALAAAVALALPGVARAGDFVAPEPEDLIFYHVFVDRFDNGNPGNDTANPTATHNPSGPSSFHGGDIEGVRRRLPYIKGLGANAIWLSPVLRNVNSYHGYGTYNWNEVDPNFGSEAELTALVAEANALGIGVYLDMVTNHCGTLIGSNNAGFPSYRAPPATYTLSWSGSLQYPPPFDSLEHFHAHGHIGNFSAPEQELGELSGLDDLKTETQYVRDAMYTIWSGWLERTGISGFRIDTVKHVELGFWQDFLPRMEARALELGRPTFFTFGEIFGADDNYMRQYVGTLNGGPYKLDAALDFQFYYTSQSVFARADSPTSWMASRLQARASSLGSHHLKTPNFFDNHDVRRFMNVAGDVPGSGLAERRRRLELALVMLMTAPGPPIVYYGTEQAFDGGNDPYNREDMFDGAFEFGASLGDNFDTTSTQYRLVKKLAALRAKLTPLRRGSFVARQTSSSGPGVLAYSRLLDGAEVIVAMNTATSERTISAFSTLWPQGQMLVNALDPTATVTIGLGGAMPARTLAGQAAEVWIRAEDLPPVAPEVVALSPADGENGVALEAVLAIRFSVPMERTSTEAAVTIVPTIAYAAAWDEESIELTLTPDAPLTPRTNYALAVATDALAADDTPLEVPATATWQTGRDLSNLPPLPPAFPAMERTDLALTIDGSGADWTGLPPLGANEGGVGERGVFRWVDAIGDDNGPGTYTYPTNAVFTGGDADLAEFRFAFDATDLYFYFRPASINPGASFFTPYFGVAIDTAPGGSDEPLGYDQRDVVAGEAEVVARPDAAPEFELVFTGPRGADLVDGDGTPLLQPESAFSQATGEVEIRVPRAALGLDVELVDAPLTLMVYSGLETFGSLREVTTSASQWEPGGGIVSPTDPDVFDLAGAAPADQLTDLADYDTQTHTLVLHSFLRLVLRDAAPPDPGPAGVTVY